jgi:hypothetical protein
VAGPVSVTAGATFNVFVDCEAHKIDFSGHGWSAGPDVRLWPGFLAAGYI